MKTICKINILFIVLLIFFGVWGQIQLNALFPLSNFQIAFMVFYNIVLLVIVFLLVKKIAVGFLVEFIFLAFSVIGSSAVISEIGSNKFSWFYFPSQVYSVLLLASFAMAVIGGCFFIFQLLNKWAFLFLRPLVSNSQYDFTRKNRLYS